MSRILLRHREKLDTNMKRRNVICNTPNITLSLRTGKHSGEESNNGETDICISILERKSGCPRDKSAGVKDVRVHFQRREICGESSRFLQKTRKEIWNGIKSESRNWNCIRLVLYLPMFPPLFPANPVCNKYMWMCRIARENFSNHVPTMAAQLANKTWLHSLDYIPEP